MLRGMRSEDGLPAINGAMNSAEKTKNSKSNVRHALSGTA